MKPFAAQAKWLSAEFGLTSVATSGRDAWLVILMRTSRMFAFGAVSLVFALFLSALGNSDGWIGFFMTATMAGDVIVSLCVTLVADQLGRRRVLFAGAILMVASGAIFALFENYWFLLLAAIVGVVSASGGDFGPFRSIEESTISHLTTSTTRPDVLSWYVTSASVGSAIGTEISGRVVKALRDSKTDDPGSTKSVYHAMFWVYVAAGAVCMTGASLMSAKSEISEQEKATDAEAATQSAEPLLEGEGDDDGGFHTTEDVPAATPKTKKSWITTMVANARMETMSPASRAAVHKLWFLLAVDSLADGMASYGLTIYYLARKFAVSESYLGDIMSICYILMAVSTIFASPLARRLGLVNTMVFTHIPSSAAVLLFPLPQALPLTIVLLFIRTGLNNMDQAPRAALIAAIVKPEERTAVMGITGMLRTLAATLGPSITGLLSTADLFWVAFVMAGVLRLAYDFGLWYLFKSIDLTENEPKQSANHDDDDDDE